MSDPKPFDTRGISLRPLTEDELPAASALCMRSKAYWGYDDAFMEACRDELTLRSRDLIDSNVIVAAMGDTIAGVAQISFENREAELDKLFIEPALIGRGIGRVLFDWAREQAMAGGATNLAVTADPDAAAFYRKMGFVSNGEEPSGSIPGRKLPVLSLRL